jgi:nucleotide-binding universal stress UspA family protein
MYERVVVCGVDDSPGARRAANSAAELADALRARLVLVTVVPPLARPDANAPAGHALDGNEHPVGQALLHRLKRQEQRLQDACEHIEVGTPADALVRVAETCHAELLVVGTRARGPLKEAFFGSVSQAVMESAPCPVVVLPPTASNRRADSP